MSTFLGYLGLALILGGVFGCAVFSMAACVRSGQISRDDDAGAPEGATIIPFIPERRHPSR